MNAATLVNLGKVAIRLGARGELRRNLLSWHKGSCPPKRRTEY